MTDSETRPELPERPSKSARKREAQALRDLGAELVGLSDRELGRIPLPADLLTTVVQTRQLKAREARRRQLQYIGKLLRQMDPGPIQHALETLRRGHQEDARRFQRLETLRDQLLNGGDSSVDELMQQYPNADGQHLRQLVRRARLEADGQRPQASARKLFRYLREIVPEEDPR